MSSHKNTVPLLTHEKILHEYGDVFRGLGCLPGEYIDVDPSVNPVQHVPCRVAAALQKPSKKKLEDLEQMEVIIKATKPTEWVNPMLTVAKPGGTIRICLGPQDLNKAIWRTHYRTRTLEEVLPLLANAEVFSVLDAKMVSMK